MWDKQLHNVGAYVSNRHEFLLICTKGSATPDRVTPMLDSVVSVQKGKHSEKPAQFRKMIERLYDGPYLELFGREQVEGWTVYGNDPALLGKKTEKQEKPKKNGRKKKGVVESASGEELATIDESTTVSDDADLAINLTPEQISAVDAELAKVPETPANLCKKHRKEPKPCAKCKAEKQARKASKK